MNVLSLFSGIGGLDLGLERAGMTVVGQVEIDSAEHVALFGELNSPFSHERVGDGLKLGVEHPVLTSRADPEVVGPIIELLTVDVMHDLPFGQTPAQRFLDDQNVLWDVLVGSSVLWREHHPIAPPVDELASAPRDMFGALASSVLGVGDMPPPPAVVVQGLLSDAEGHGNGTPALTCGMTGLDLFADDRLSGRRHGDILS